MELDIKQTIIVDLEIIFISFKRKIKGFGKVSKHDI